MIFPQSFSNITQVPPNVFLFCQTFSLFAESSPEVLKMLKIPATIRGPGIWTKNKQLLFSPNIQQTIRRVQHMYPNCSPLFANCRQIPESGEQLGNIWQINEELGQKIMDHLGNVR